MPDDGLVILDASALLALIRNEPGAETVAGVLPDAVMSAVNVVEVMRRLGRDGVPTSEIERSLLRFDIQYDVFSLEDARLAADIANENPDISLGDCACLALAKRLGAMAVTADRVWGERRAGVNIRQIRPA